MKTVMAFALAACGSSEVEFENYRFEPLPGWTASDRVEAAYHTLTLLHDDRSFACEVIILRDGRLFRPIDATAFVADARRAFGAQEEERATLALGRSELEGYRMRGVTHRRRWDLRGGAIPTLEIYAIAERAELFSITLAGFDGAPPDRRDQCVRMVENARD